ncbi:DUF7507 domain-containing protein [Paenibacillus sp. HW567]|uniref:DUF7507 domain-containing protein n=1 Tax=Paenibacillus sp. HW567 TaxID=1034769 RepID=UPI00037AE395|nr:DUF11 domain-containing protein [Paenibacillus sp. HW567]
MAFVERYSINENGAVTFTGNTLGLSRSETTGVPGTVDSIGAYITTNTAQQFGTYPPGTTNVILNNSSAAILQIPAGSTILYSELIWGGTFIDGTENNTALINNPVLFTTPLGQTSVLSDPATRFEVVLSTATGFPTTYAYVRSADVTTLVSAAGAGTYTAGNIVGTLSIPDPTSNHAGWTLGVVYRNPALPLRNMSLRVTADVILSTQGPVNMIIDGFATPFMGPLAGRALFSSQEGDANKTGDQARFGPTIPTLTALSGPNNFPNNFFASQINNDTGNLDTSGTFGTRNQINGTPGTNIVGGRQGWDITNVDIGFTLQNAQTQAVIQLTTNGDGYLLDGNALQIDINIPALSAVKSTNVPDAVLGDIVTYTIKISNNSLVDATSVMFFDNIPAGSTFVTNSITVNGVIQPGTNPGTGVLIGTLVSGATATVTFQVTVTSVPSPARLLNQAKIGYTAPTVPGGPVINTSVPSNAVEVPIFQPVISIVKSANTANALVGDTVTYTLLVSNTGNIGATNIVFDNIPDGSVFVPGSVAVNGVVQPAANPVSGIPVGIIPPNTSATVTFQVNVVSQPSSLQLVDQGSSRYTFQPPDGRVIPGSAVSNTVSIPVSIPMVSVLKSTAATDAVVGDIITYSIKVTNQDGEIVTGVLLTDSIPDGSVFVPGSVTLNGVTLPAASPVTGISIPLLLPGASATATFNVMVVALPNPPELNDQAQVTFSSGTFTGSSFSNSITVPVYQPIITLSKSSVPAFAVVGEILTFRITVFNTGNIAATTTLTDMIQAEAAFVPGTVLVNNIPQPGTNPNTGIPLGVIPAGGSVFVTFQIVVNSLPASQQLLNLATADFTFTPPDGRVIPGSSDSNPIIVPISPDNITVVKSASELEAVDGDIITYSFVIKNNDPVAVTDVTLTDAIPPGSVLVPNSVTLNGAPVTGASPVTGIPIGSIAASEIATVTFQVLVTGTPPPVPLPLILTDQASVVFSTGDFTGTALSNIVNIRVFEPVITLLKSATPATASVGDIITYTVQVTNEGNFNADVFLTDPLPPGLTFVQNSVLINGNRWSSADPNSSINLGTVQPAFPLTVTFLAVVTSLPVPPELTNQATGNYTYTLPDGRVLTDSSSSNEVTIPVTATDLITVTKAADRLYAVPGDLITYTLTVINNTPSPIAHLVVTDPIPPGSSFVPESVTVDGISVPAANPATGIAIETLAANAQANITFQTLVSETMPPVANPYLLTDQATASFTSGEFAGTAASNLVNVQVLEPIINLVKSASPATTSIGDVLTYTIIVTNSGNFGADTTLLDPLPAEERFVPGSVTVNGTAIPEADPATGIMLGTVQPRTALTVSFQASVIALPSPPQLANQAIGNYTYTLPDGRILTETTVSNIIITPVAEGALLSVTKAASSAAVVNGDLITFTLTVVNNTQTLATNVILTDLVPEGTSFISGSVTLQGIPLPGADPAAGIPIGNLDAGLSAVVAFQVQVTNPGTAAQLSNQGIVNYTIAGISGSAASNIVNIPVYEPNIIIEKSGEPAQTTLGGTIHYTLKLSNLGGLSASLIVVDSIPAGTQFTPGSLRVDGIVVNSNPANGIPLGIVTPGTSVLITFDVTVQSIPATNQVMNSAQADYSLALPDGRIISGTVDSNPVITIISDPLMEIIKTFSPAQATPGGSLTFSFRVVNGNNSALSDIIFKDLIPEGTTFVAGSVVVRDAVIPGADPAAGFVIENIAPESTISVSFKVFVNNNITLSEIVNQASSSYRLGKMAFQVFSNRIAVPVFLAGPPVGLPVNSPVNLPATSQPPAAIPPSSMESGSLLPAASSSAASQAAPTLTVLKSAGSSFSEVGETLTFTILITNISSIPAQNLLLKDKLQKELSVIPGSITIQGIPQPAANLPSGVVLSSLLPGGTLNISYSALIKRQPPSGKISNQAVISLQFLLAEGSVAPSVFTSNICVVSVSEGEE